MSLGLPALGKPFSTIAYMRKFCMKLDIQIHIQIQIQIQIQIEIEICRSYK